jgi:effector-binding domain-containing protein
VKIPDTETVSLDAGKAISVDHYGSYNGLQAAHDAIDKFAQANGLKTKMPVIEEYVTGPQMEPDSTKWLTRIYYLLDQ